LLRAGRWKERLFSLDDPDDVDRTEYFLPYIRRFLFPSLFANKPAEKTDGGEGETEQNTRKQTCWHFTFDLAKLGAVNGEKGLPLTLRGKHLPKNMNIEHRLVLESIDLIVFSYRVAFLIFRFRGTEPGVTYFDQMEALNYLRTIAPLYRDFEMPELVTGEGE